MHAAGLPDQNIYTLCIHGPTSSVPVATTSGTIPPPPQLFSVAHIQAGSLLVCNTHSVT